MSNERPYKLPVLTTTIVNYSQIICYVDKKSRDQLISTK